MAESQKGLLVRPIVPEDPDARPDATLFESRRVLLDTNILVDYLDARRAKHSLARELVHAALGAGMALAAAASSYKDMYYILRRSLKDEVGARGLIRGLIECVPITAVDLRAADLAPAIASNEPDFEDGIVRTLAEAWGASFIISRDERAFAGSSIPRVSAREFLELVGTKEG